MRTRLDMGHCLSRITTVPDTGTNQYSLRSEEPIKKDTKGTPDFSASKSDSTSIVAGSNGQNREKKKAEMVCIFWMRTVIGINNTSLDSLVAVVVAYYQTLTFQWNPLRKHEELTLSDDKRTFHKTTPSSYKSLCSTNMVSAATTDIVRWEVTLRQKGAMSLTGFEMGYIEGEYIEFFKESLYIGRNTHWKEVAFGMTFAFVTMCL